MNQIDGMTPPRARTDFLASPDVEKSLVQALNAGALANGWLITGGEGAGKATLAFRLARALLWNARPNDLATLEVPKSKRAYSLVASGAHPDLFVAERQYDDKKDRHATEISVEVIRELTQFLNHTAAMGGWRVAIIDTADDLNRNSANALLKALEEPPPRTAIFVLSAVPGRLLATIRSRCRRIDLKPAPEAEIAQFLVREGAAAERDAVRIAAASSGRPGFALSLALGDGKEGIEVLEHFWNAATGQGDIAAIAQRLSGKNADGVWPHFKSMLIRRLAAQASDNAMREGEQAGSFADLYERINVLFTRGDAVNLDRAQMVMAAARAMKKVLAVAH